MFSMSTSSTTVTNGNDTPRTAKEKEMKGKEKKEKAKKAKGPNKRSFFGPSAMEDLRREHAAVEATVSMQPLGIGAQSMTQMTWLSNQPMMNILVRTWVLVDRYKWVSRFQGRFQYYSKMSDSVLGLSKR
jgi:hypothetical protein